MSAVKCWVGWLSIFAILSLLLSCATPASQPEFPPSESDLELLGTTRLCDAKPLILASWEGTSFTRKPWGSGEQLQRIAQSLQPDHDRFYFFNEDDVFVGGVFRYLDGLSLQPYSVLRGTLTQLNPTFEVYLNSTSLLGGRSLQTAVLYRTGDKTSTTQYLVLESDDAPKLLVASVAIDPYEPLLTSYQKAFLPGFELSQGVEGRTQGGDIVSEKAKDFLALQQFARGEAALFASCGVRDAKMAIKAYTKAISHGFEDSVRLSETHHRLGLALQEEGLLQESRAQLEQALTIRPNVPEVINHLGAVVAQQGHRIQASELFERAIILKPNYARARFNLAEALEVVNPSRAIEEYETYLALAEGIPEEEGRATLVRKRVKKLKGE
ncbi:MAG: hypothetical protein IH977_08925 [Nitrospinae bacterium]|nr:hypothetical protein [Nitrospinota bacterium]